MDFSEKWGTDVEEAVKLALIDLKLERDEVEVTVLEEPSKGFFGIGSKLAKVRVEPKKKVVEETAVSEMKPEIKEEQPSTIEETAESDKALEQRKTEKRKKDRKKKKRKRQSFLVNRKKIW